MALSKITTASLSDNAVTTAKITDANITTAKIADANITTAKVADDAVTNAKIGAGAITNTEVNASAGIVATKLGTMATANMPSGNIIQVQSTTSNTEVADTSGNYNGSLLEVNITPTATSSKIFLLVNFFTGYFNPNGAFRLNRVISGGATTSLAEATAGYDSGTGFLAMDDVAGYGTNGNISDYVMHSWAFSHLDSPSTTSQITYKLQAHSIYSMYFNRSQGNNYGHSSSTISAMELKQ